MNTENNLFVFGWEVPYKYVLSFLKRNRVYTCVEAPKRRHCMCGVTYCWEDIAECFPPGVRIVNASPRPRSAYSERRYFVTLLNKKEEQEGSIPRHTLQGFAAWEIEDGRKFVESLQKEHVTYGNDEPPLKVRKWIRLQEDEKATSTTETAKAEKTRPRQEEKVEDSDSDDVGVDIEGDIGEPHVFYAVDKL